MFCSFNKIKVIDLSIQEKIKLALLGKRKITFLVGAGLSSESGIPTFRDVDGYWTKGSENYTPEEMGTLRMFNKNAHLVWNWFLHRINICRNAKPNKGHFALTEIQKLFPDRFELISQNVDGLHFQTAMDESHLYLIHGDLRYMRCGDGCSDEITPIPKALVERGAKEQLEYDEIQLLNCPNCGELCRPHVLWFDELYNEKFYKLHTVLRIAKKTDILFVIGTSGATNLPKRVVENVLANSGVVVDINPNENLFTMKLSQLKNGFWIQEKSGTALPELVELMKKIKP